MLELSEASPADARELSAFAIKTYVDAFGAGFRPDDLEHHLETRLSLSRWRAYLAHDHVLLARLAGQLAGYVQFGPANVAGEVEVHRLYVDNAWQSSGIGSRLLAAALDHPQAAAAKAVWIDVWEDNPRARALYERFGFVAEGRRAFILPSGQVGGYDILMVRRADNS